MPITDQQKTLGRRLMWFAILWVGSLVAVASVAYLLRGLLFLAR